MQAFVLGAYVTSFFIRTMQVGRSISENLNLLSPNKLIMYYYCAKLQASINRIYILTCVVSRRFTSLQLKCSILWPSINIFAHFRFDIHSARAVSHKNVFVQKKSRIHWNVCYSIIFFFNVTLYEYIHTW